MGWCVCTEDPEFVRMAIAERPDGTGLRVEFTLWADFDEHQVHWGARTSRREPTQSWTLIGPALALEFDRWSAREMGVAPQQRITLDVDEDSLRQVRDHLMTILAGSTCYAVDCLGLRARE
jgi:hypothetical protein